MLATWIGRGLTDFAASIRLKHVWAFLAWQDVFAKYRRSVLGPFWIAASIVASAVSLSLVFGALFRQPLVEFLPYIMAGLVVWSLVGLPFGDGPETFMSAGGVIKNHAFPFSLYVLRMITRNLILFAHNIVVLVAAMLVVGGFRGFHWQVIPGLLLVTAFATIYCGLVGLAAARYRDLRFLLPVIGQMLFFVTPIFWKAEAIQDGRAVIYKFNPFYHMLSILREPLLGASVPLVSWIIAVTLVLGGAVLWLVAFGKFRPRIAFWV